MKITCLLYMLSAKATLAFVLTRFLKTPPGSVGVNHFATIYAWDDGGSPNEPNADELAGPNSLEWTATTPDKALDLIELLSKESVAALARLAVAFSPPEQSLDIRHIQHVEVLGVDENHITIEAVICEHDGCVTLAVPVSFPRPCGEDSPEKLKGCVLENLGELDVFASEKLRKLEWTDNHQEEVLASQRARKALVDDKNVVFPSWWANPVNEMVGEASTIRTLLNEGEFESEIAKLATIAIQSHHEEDFEVQDAVVVAVGPAGLVIRASFRDSGHLDQPMPLHVVEIPVPFREEAADVSSLRAAVLGLITFAASS